MVAVVVVEEEEKEEGGGGGGAGGKLPSTTAELLLPPQIAVLACPMMLTMISKRIPLSIARVLLIPPPFF